MGPWLKVVSSFSLTLDDTTKDSISLLYLLTIAPPNANGSLSYKSERYSEIVNHVSITHLVLPYTQNYWK